MQCCNAENFTIDDTLCRGYPKSHKPGSGKASRTAWGQKHSGPYAKIIVGIGVNVSISTFQNLKGQRKTLLKEILQYKRPWVRAQQILLGRRLCNWKRKSNTLSLNKDLNDKGALAGYRKRRRVISWRDNGLNIKHLQSSQWNHGHELQGKLWLFGEEEPCLSHPQTPIWVQGTRLVLIHLFFQSINIYWEILYARHYSIG